MKNVDTVSQIHGVLNIDKPAGITSHDVVEQVRRVVKEMHPPFATIQPSVDCLWEASEGGRRRRPKIGHAGTLDPFATGVLVVALGQATRLIEYTHDLKKTYQATFTLGATSDTDDRTGTITAAKSTASGPAADNIHQSLQQFIGEIEQTPPAYSAVKVKGKKLYELARSGIDTTTVAEARKRKVTIYDITVNNYEYPKLELEITCGSGTYIRAIARDLGRKLDIGAYVEELRRTVIGNFTDEKTTKLQYLTPDNLTQHILPPGTLVAHLPRNTLSKQQATEFQQGKPIPVEDGNSKVSAIFDSLNNLVGTAKYTNDHLHPVKVMKS